MRNFPVPGRYAQDIEVSRPELVFRDLDAAGKYEIDYTTTRRSLPVDVQDADGHMPRVDGIFDTGAQSVCLKTGLPKKWGFTKVGHAKVMGATGQATAVIWRGGLMLHLNKDVLKFQNVVCWETNLPGMVDVLIGQPIIKLFEFKVWAGFKGVTLNRVKS